MDNWLCCIAAATRCSLLMDYRQGKKKGTSSALHSRKEPATALFIALGIWAKGPGEGGMREQVVTQCCWHSRPGRNQTRSW
eukprot:363717-Chlamydomonas_euryale.AAC.8